ncbi:endonuclease/exonuclease/phosphatase family protein [Streptacidiphilus anmyonensis]|uniref:endonuclease/exonuclease/phosphatase family protein n=1 Tax=Streptacidiphilus anmyonensis TaxID=405782 RepID=UPI0009FFB300|nr:endonuclease/exonuclease/phosphatase family protein [Streptacidiphilus anmyonensis]
MSHPLPSARTTEASETDASETGASETVNPETGGGGRRARVRRAVRTVSRPEPWKRGKLLVASALLLGLLMLLHAEIPNRWSGNLGSLVETLLPWFGVCVPVLLAAALWRRSASALVALLLPVLVWLNLFGGLLEDKARPGGDLTVAEQNVNAGNPDPARTARDLAASGATVLALVELTPQSAPLYEKGLAGTYPYRTVQGTVGLWSKLPLSDTQQIDIVDYGPLAATKAADRKAAANRALRTTVATDHGPLTVYVAHLGSVRLMPRGGYWTVSRNIGAQALGRAIAADPSRRVVLLGDLNGTTDDRALAALTAQLHSTQATAGDGFGFTWPAQFPVVRIDQILVRGVTPKSSRVLPADGSDHLPVAAAISW